MTSARQDSAGIVLCRESQVPTCRGSLQRWGSRVPLSMICWVLVPVAVTSQGRRGCCRSCAERR
jgi:hypothetical protein